MQLRLGSKDVRDGVGDARAEDAVSPHQTKILNSKQTPSLNFNQFSLIFQQGNFSASQNELSSPFSTLFQDIASELAFNNGTTSGQQTIKINDFVSGVESGAPQDFSPCSWTDDIRQRGGRSAGHSFTESPVRREKSCAIASNRLICILNHRPRNNRRGCMTARRANIVAFFSFTSYF